eukprot:Blabericola_migrator_1__10974@NODE_635_length_7128_cov_111_245149_g466_i0_p3_GENE_NODE_635_length_7128_cov_111_245149_g466_i0NODE_635_length_7128_cov_111_245149_g466_i0_p3_ORF_typecomplete_len199_score14_90FoP_duplication/PF13865_6/1_8e04FoP_duplication/PF13865_6/1_1e09FoP_duplication/PF13865_6/8_5_NODE_635_length_7128_cov_111_245149_g466_i015582154
MVRARSIPQGAIGSLSNNRKMVRRPPKRSAIEQSDINKRGRRPQQVAIQVRKDGANRKRVAQRGRGSIRYFSQQVIRGSVGGRIGRGRNNFPGVANMSINRSGIRGRLRQRGGAIAMMKTGVNVNERTRRTSRRIQQGTTPPRARGRGGRRSGGGRGASTKAPSASDLDAALDAYMGEDVRKARMDSELDAYFNRPAN